MKSTSIPTGIETSRPAWDFKIPSSTGPAETPRPEWNFDIPSTVLASLRGPSGEPQRTNQPNLPLAPVPVDHLTRLPGPIVSTVLRFAGAGVLESIVHTSKQFAPIRDGAVNRVLTAQTALNVERDKHRQWEDKSAAELKVHKEGLEKLKKERQDLGKRPEGLFKGKAQANYDRSMADITKRINEHERSCLPPTNPANVVFAKMQHESAMHAFDNPENKNASPQEPVPESTVELPPSMKSWFTPPDRD